MGFNNCYILLSNFSQTIENTKFVTGDLSLICSLVLYRPTRVYGLWQGKKQWQQNHITQYNTK